MRARLIAIGACAVLSQAGIQPANAGPALLFEPANGKLLYAEDPDSLWHPASLTKVMTAYVTFKAIKAGRITLDQKIPCSLVATLQPPSKVGLNVGAEMSVEKALQAIIIKSANDVTVMLAEAVSGSETKFVEEMNAVARDLGMSRTHFANTNGLPDPSQITTARDLAKLARAVVAEFPEYASYWSMTDMRIGNKRLGSHNALLKTFPGADGLKTGFTCDSGFNVVASATRDGRRLMAVVLGESSGNERAIRAASLLEHGFQTQDWKALFSQTSIDNLPVDPAAKGITSVRADVLAWDCGNRKRKSSGPGIVRKKKKKPADGDAANAAPAAVERSADAAARPALKGTQTGQDGQKPKAAAGSQQAN